MGLFTSNPSGSGVFAQKVPTQAVITPAGFTTAIGVAQFLWGPTGGTSGAATGVEVSGIASYQNLVNVYAPAGSNRLTPAYLSLINKLWGPLNIVRVTGPTAAQATAIIKTAGAVALFTVTAAYVGGSVGNAISVTIAAASDGNSNHFNMVLQLSGASGTTTEVYKNLNVSGVGANVLPPSIQGLGGNFVIGQVGSNVGTSVLAASVTFTSAGLPATGTTVMTGGSDGTVASTQYIGTQGTGGAYGFAVTEGDLAASTLWIDDPGVSLRAAVNAGLVGHLGYMTSRIGFTNGNTGQTVAQAQTDVANYRSPYLVYTDPWVYTFDDVVGSLQLVPGGPWAASLSTQMNPALSIAWRGVGGPLLNGIQALEQYRGQAAASNTAAGITTFDAAPTGPGASTGPKFYFEQDVCTDTSDLDVNRMDLYLAKSVFNSWQPFVNAPQLASYHQDLLNSLQIFLNQLQTNGATNPAALPFIAGATTPVIQSTPYQLQQGQFIVAVQASYAGSMKQLILSLQSGNQITLTTSSIP